MIILEVRECTYSHYAHLSGEQERKGEGGCGLSSAEAFL